MGTRTFLVTSAVEVESGVRNSEPEKLGLEVGVWNPELTEKLGGTEVAAEEPLRVGDDPEEAGEVSFSM